MRISDWSSDVCSSDLAEIRHFEYARDAQAYEHARDACERAARMDPGLHELSLAFGDMYRVSGESTKAIEQYTRALEDTAFADDANLGIANVPGDKGHTELTLEYMHSASSRLPGDGGGYLQMGSLTYAYGNIQGGTYRTNR